MYGHVTKANMQMIHCGHWIESVYAYVPWFLLSVNISAAKTKNCTNASVAAEALISLFQLTNPMIGK